MPVRPMLSFEKIMLGFCMDRITRGECETLQEAISLVLDDMKVVVDVSIRQESRLQGFINKIYGVHPQKPVVDLSNVKVMGNS